MEDVIKTEIEVNNEKIKILRIGENEYISLTDLARYANPEEPKIPIQTWMRNKDVILYLGLWEKLNNKDFKGREFTTFENNSGKNSFYMSPQKWIKETNAIGIVSKSGHNGGTYAHSDIAFEFASWLSPEFKLYVITEFQRLKKNEQYQNQIEWNVRRIISKGNYKIHTDAVKDKLILPILTKEQIKYTYASEADVLNVALFGMTASQWRSKNKNKKGNIRDYAAIEQLIVLSNMESSNSIMIRENIPQCERLKKLNEYALIQLRSLQNNASISELKELESSKLIESK
ncbi:hypothetical protein MmiHf6_01810 [Methanimicrococcus hongohii]|uniref:KilA-N domain-containing protein n=1 Tax=Methanimicrococcus hongohii TaxID=3028295 RepID=A0AA96UYF0_9EURY|nr:KilA-N domain-containing protein [Methanimicrococcus sp. Hf6]WNY22889.1 hypothetical protein MmiHf6_01810 [Methanimicrococcus sp. Hf6]